MGYIRKTIHAGNTVEVEEHFTNRFGIHDTRKKKEKPTSEQVREAYARRQKKHLRWLLNENFRDGLDAWVTLSWRKGAARPDGLDGTKRAAGAFFRKLREEYRGLGMELKYIYCVEIGPRGALHIHAVISGAGEIPLMLLQRCWDGVADVKPLYTGGQYEDLANYMVKQYGEKTERTTGQEMRRCFECSRNLRKPRIEVERIKERDIRKDINPPPGHVLDKSSVREGVGKATGRPYRFYRLLKLGGQVCAGAGTTAENPRMTDHEQNVPGRPGSNTLFERLKKWVRERRRKR